MTDKLTPYQEELLALVAAGSPSAGPAEPIDFDELLERLSWQPTKAAAHFSIRALTRRELLAKLQRQYRLSDDTVNSIHNEIKKEMEEGGAN